MGFYHFLENSRSRIRNSETLSNQTSFLFPGYSIVSNDTHFSFFSLNRSREGIYSRESLFLWEFYSISFVDIFTFLPTASRITIIVYTSAHIFLFFCVTQLKLYTLNKLSSTIFCCLCVCVCVWGIGVTRPNLHLFQYIQAYKPYADCTT